MSIKAPDIMRQKELKCDIIKSNKVRNSKFVVHIIPEPEKKGNQNHLIFQLIFIIPFKQLAILLF